MRLRIFLEDFCSLRYKYFLSHFSVVKIKKKTNGTEWVLGSEVKFLLFFRNFSIVVEV